MINYKCGDIVTFHVHDKEYKCQVLFDRLLNLSKDETIWEALSFKCTDMKEFCEKAFGYPPCDITHYHDDDYDAASRLIQNLQMQCDLVDLKDDIWDDNTAIASCKGPVESTIERFNAGRPEEVMFRHDSKPTPYLKYKKGDKVIFNVNGKSYEYEVCDAFLCCMELCSTNNIIFKALNIETPVNFCTAAYGYAADPLDGNGAFPECIDGDIAALNRVIEALQIECQHFGHEVSSKGYRTPSEEFLRWCKECDDYDKDALLTVRKSNTCKF